MRWFRDAVKYKPVEPTFLYDLAIAVVISYWLWSSLQNGEHRVRGLEAKREDEPVKFWLGCGLLALLVVVSILHLLGVNSKHPQG